MMARKICCGTCAPWICHQKSRCTISEEKACKYRKYSLSLPPISITDQNRLPMYMQTSTYHQEDHYYPYGGLMGESTGGDVQRYKYNGKELDRMHGLDWFMWGMATGTLFGGLAIIKLFNEYRLIHEIIH